MAAAGDFANMVPGFDFFQGLMKSAGAGMPGLPAPGQPQQIEMEEDFDPKDFDVTASVLDLPAPRRGATNQPLPDATTNLPTAMPAQRRAIPPAFGGSNNPMKP